MKLNFKIIFIGLFFTSIYIYAAYSYMAYTKENQLNEKYQDISLIIKDKVKTLIAEKKESILLISLSLSENQDIKKALLFKKITPIYLYDFSQKLKNYSSLQNAWFQIVTADGVSLYRSWTKKHGDDIKNARKDIVDILKKPRVFSTISVGKYDMTFKSLVPIYEKEKFIGLVETIAKFNSISNKMKNDGYHNLLLVDKKYKRQLSSEVKNKRFIGDYYIANQNADKNLVKIVKKQINKYVTIKDFLVQNNTLLTVFSIADIHGKAMAYFIFTKDLSTVNMSEIKNKKITLISIFSLIYIFVGLIVYYFYFVNYKQFLQKQKRVLQESVEEKTKELQLKTESLKFQAEHDALTNLPNRTLFLDRLKQALEFASENKQKISVLFLDLDRFKEINDTYGHEVGDTLLKHVTKRLKNKLQIGDTIARLGGDEFILLIKDLDKNAIIEIINNIIQSMQEAFFINEIEIYTTFSIGISSYPKDGTTSQELLRNADTAMYKAKENGKNNYYFYNAEMTQLAKERMELDKSLRKALENEEFVAYFQPKVDAKHRKVVGLEALVRWQHPTQGLIFPDTFIPFAEETGLIDKIDNYMMKAAMKQVLEWQNKGIECGQVSINISSRQLTSRTYLKELQDTINSVGFDTKYLEIEITETHIMADPEYAMEILRKIRDLGISISIDDFGTGYSSLAYLKKLPITKLKIDRSFVIGIPDDKEDVAIVRTIISLANNLGLNMIAEGAETKEQVDCLVKEGCNNIQGYYFSKPLSKEACEEFLVNF